MAVKKCHRWARQVSLGALLCVALTGMSCSEPSQTGDMNAYYDSGRYITVTDPIAFTDQPYEFTGESSIADVLALFPGFESVWYGFGAQERYPIEGDCDPGRTNSETIPANLQELPMTIEGIVTLHPRHFQKIAVCGSEERYYGTFIMQDSTGGIQVMKDSRIAEFDYGDRLRLRVRGIIKYFDTYAVLVYDEEEVLNSSDARYPIYYQNLSRNIVRDDVGKVARVRGVVSSEATNQNFNEMVIQSVDDSSVTWTVSLDRELGVRRAAPAVGAHVEITGPVIDSFGLRILVASLGQMTYLTDEE